MTSIETLKKIGELLVKAEETQRRVYNAESRVAAIKHEQAEYHRDKLLFEIRRVGKIENKIDREFEQILAVLHECTLVGKQVKQFADGEPFRNDITPKAGSSSVALRYAQKPRVQQLMI